MSRDIEVLVFVEGRCASIATKHAYDMAAEHYGMTVTGVRGMCSRARNTVEGQVAVQRWLADNAPKTSVSQLKINALVGKSEYCIEKQRERTWKIPGYAVWCGDLHEPVSDPASKTLFYKILAELKNVHWITGLNDGLDFAKISHWPDRRAIRKQRIDADIDHAITIYKKHLNAMHRFAPEALTVGVTGNHDLRIHTVGLNTGTDLWNVHHVMEDLYSRRLVFPAAPTHENVFFVNGSLAWFHGRHATANRVGGAVKNYRYTKRITGRRSDYDLVFGHTHALMETRYDNITIHNGGCLCKLQPDWSRHAFDWQRGMVVSAIERDSNETINIAFEQDGNILTARNPFTGTRHTARIT